MLVTQMFPHINSEKFIMEQTYVNRKE